MSESRYDQLRAAQLAVAQLPDMACVTWCEGAEPLVEGIHLGTSVDITADGLTGGALPWLWTVVTPEDPAASDGPIPASDLPGISSPYVIIPHDVAVWAVFDPARRWYDTVSAIAVELDEEPTAEQLVALYEVADTLAGEIEFIPGWRSTTIDAALERWCDEHLNRRDITFCEDPDGVPAYIEALVARGLESEPGYEIADGVTVTDEVFDQLLQLDPDVAAALTEALRQLADDLATRDVSDQDDDER